MGYWPKKMRRRRHSWVANVGRKLVLLGAEGSHGFIWPNRPKWRRRVYYLDCQGKNISGFSPTAAVLRSARMMEII